VGDLKFAFRRRWLRLAPQCLDGCPLVRVAPRLVPILLALLGALPAPAHDLITTKVTFSREISRIFVGRCLSCHRDGGIAPMALDSYEAARPWAKAIKEEVLHRRMPPWGAVKGFGEFHPDPSLSQEEVKLIADWVEGGAPEGDPALLPPMIAPEPKWKAPRVATVIVPTQLKLAKATQVIGLEPLQDAASTRVFARLPDGSAVPLLWLRDFKLSTKRRFWLREPVALPAGSVVEADAPLNFRLLVPAAPRSLGSQKGKARKAVSLNRTSGENANSR
jgi:mono/diheme cytochrome c family protein